MYKYDVHCVVMYQHEKKWMAMIFVRARIPEYLGHLGNDICESVCTGTSWPTRAGGRRSRGRLGPTFRSGGSGSSNWNINVFFNFFFVFRILNIHFFLDLRNLNIMRAIVVWWWINISQKSFLRTSKNWLQQKKQISISKFYNIHFLQQKKDQWNHFF